MKTHTLTDEELVEIAKAVLGEVNSAAPGTLTLRLYRGTKSLEMEFRLQGSVMGTFLVPIPPTILHMIQSQRVNPYDSVDVYINPRNAQPGPTPQSEPEGTER